jgi:gluconolactonase
VPIFDSFNDSGNRFGNVEGPVWIESEGALFVSEIGDGSNPPPSRILKITPTGTVSIALADAGSNGLAVDGMGRLIAANHKVGGLVALSLTGGAATTLVSTYMNARFDSPNDLAIRSDGTIYFSDPDWQAPSTRPQTKTRVYKVAPGASTATVIDENRQQPNGVTLSLDENTLFVSSAAGIYKYTIDASGTVSAGTQYATSVSSGDGMVMDCAGNLYIAANSNSQLVVLSPTGTVIAMVNQQGITNVAFGGTDHKTLYLTAQGTGKNGPMGLFKIAMPLPGMPY